MMQRPGSAQELHFNALMAQVQLGLGLLSLDYSEQLLEMGATLQGVWQDHGNVYQPDGQQIVVNPHVASLVVFV